MVSIHDSSGFQIGNGNTLNVHLPPAVADRATVRSRYSEQVRRFVPSKLLGRHDELAELTDFCTAPQHAGRYAWWRAEAWAGKSALMSWFALHPPPAVRIVCFFVTARWPNQNDRTAFIDTVLEQLAEILQEPIPTTLTQTTREAHLLGMLRDAAELCCTRGEQLVLIVDGLDEDLGVTVGANAYSIAGLLPTEPPAGLRVVVTGRPHPPIPSDVYEHHPLRDPAIVRTLPASSAAVVIRDSMIRELRRLLENPAGRELLGVLTAAGGGLTAAELAKLTDMHAQEVTEHLRAAAGRSFQTRAPRWRNDGDDVYIFGHEELRTTAADLFAPSQLAAYRQRIHDWAGHHRHRGWPADTPEYLLGGYYAMLAATGDLAAMTIHATDTLRHDRMLIVSGLDSAALTEIRIAQAAVLAQQDPDLVAAGCLAVQHDYLMARNSNIPVRLPAVWAAIGDRSRADELARLITDPQRRFEALIELIKTSNDEDRERVRYLLNEARSLLSSIHTPAGDDLWASLIRTAVIAGRHHWVAAEIEAIGRPAQQSDALKVLVEALGQAGEVDQAEIVARAIVTHDQRIAAYASLAISTVRAGDLERAASLLDYADAGADAAATSDTRDILAAARARLAAAMGRLMDALELAETITVPDLRSQALVDLMSAIAQSHPRLARRITHSIEDEDRQTEAIEHLLAAAELDEIGVVLESFDAKLEDWAPYLVCLLSDTGHTDRARALLAQVEESAPFRSPDEKQAEVVPALAQAAVFLGEFNRAEALVRRTRDPERVADGLTALASALVSIGEPNKARELALDAESAARRGTKFRDSVPAEALRALAATGEADCAMSIAAAATPSPRGSRPMEALAAALAELGDYDGAEVVAMSTEDCDTRDRVLVSVVQNVQQADRVEAIAEWIAHPACRTEARLFLAKILIDAGSLDRAETVLRAEADSGSDTWRRAVTDLVRASVAANDDKRTRSLLDWVSEITDAYTSSEIERVEMSLWAVEAMACAAAVDAAEAQINAITDGIMRDMATVRLGRELARAGKVEQAEAVARAVRSPLWRAMLEVDVVHALADLNELDRAEWVIESMIDGTERDGALGCFVWAVCETGDIDRTQTLADAIIDEQWNAWGQTAVLYAACIAEEPERARRAAFTAFMASQFLPSPKRRVDMLSLVVELLLEVDTRDSVEHLIHSIPDVRARGAAWLALAHHEPTPHALAQAFRLCSWTEPLDLLAKVQPDSVMPIVEKFRGLKASNTMTRVVGT
jgi:tetratricopeptide (TPR) repeat protein